jgi:hypothetical protein
MPEKGDIKQCDGKVIERYECVIGKGCDKGHCFGPGGSPPLGSPCTHVAMYSDNCWCEVSFHVGSPLYKKILSAKKHDRWKVLREQ